MEKSCEFCKALRAAVYCISDAAHLCLSCDAKVHSANALSLRHPRTLVCDSCRCHPSLVRCFDHRMFMCQTCDSGLHASLHHRRKVVASYVGCPSAKDLAHLWGLDFKQLMDNLSVPNESQGGTTTPKAKVVNDESSQKSSYLILVQQILDLERLQLSDSSSVNVKERTQFRRDTTWRYHNNHVEGHLEFQPADNPVGDDKTEEPLSSPFPQLDNLNGGDSFWQYKSPLHSNEIWLQNMQDLGVCDEEQYFDDVEIPDVDLTFRNFEEVFGIEDDNVACSFAYNHLPSSDRGCTSTIEETNDVERVHQTQTNHDRVVRPSYSSSVSRITGESSASEYKDDDELSPTFLQHRLPHDSETTDCKENAIARYKEKRVLRQEKQGHYTSPRSKSEFKKRGKSQVM